MQVVLHPPQLITRSGSFCFPTWRNKHVSAAGSSWTRKTQDVQEGMEKLPAEVAQGSGEEKPVEATASDDEDRAAAMSSEPAAKEEPTVPIEAQDATETKPLLAAEQDPAPPVQGGSRCLSRQHKACRNSARVSPGLYRAWAGAG